MKVGHFHDDLGPSHFTKVVMSPSLELLPIPEGFMQYVGNVPKTIMMKINTGSSWMVKLRDFEGKISMDQGWTGFAIAHDIKIGYLLTLKTLKSDVYKVTIFNYSMCEIIKKYPQHDLALSMMEE
ncbi:putative B3 domain-containing protein Os03g0621600 [Lolium perenne]|uniref:putative B3 domain-containing protein Os03g0621600 n=1 Tax=Lolium perenne TaxID=4522 RepID=UPI003A99DF2E